jgi:hypothetical protein
MATHGNRYLLFVQAVGRACEGEAGRQSHGLQIPHHVCSAGNFPPKRLLVAALAATSCHGSRCIAQFRLFQF